MNSHLTPLHKKSLIIIFAYSPAGLGHLRVTDALFHGLPAGVSPLLLGSKDSWIGYIHRVTSIHPIGRAMFEWVQEGAAQEFFTRIYRFFLRSQTKNIYNQMETIIDQRLEVPQTVLVVATHFGLAHQLAAIKTKLMLSKNVKVVLVVQVTDDSPQYIWYISGADITFVPSERTKEHLIRYGKQEKLAETEFIVNPYPITPLLAESHRHYEERRHQLDPLAESRIHVSLPISGAAVGTEYFATLAEQLHLISERFFFHIVTKNKPFTRKFLDRMATHAYTELYTSSFDRGVVDAYQHLYRTENISMEITKPSEQAFKALFTPHQKGGSILLFTTPVGRQEYDNLDFLTRHRIIPQVGEQKNLWLLSKNTHNSDIDKELVEKAKQWRGLVIPDNPLDATLFIAWCLKNNIFYNMAQYEYDKEAENKAELSGDGVEEFWKKVSHLLTQDSLSENG